MITVDKLIATQYGKALKEALLDLFNNSYGETQALVLGSITYSQDLKMDDMVQNLHQCTKVNISSFVQTGDEISMILELRGDDNYPGGEHSRVLCTLNFRITLAGLILLLSNK